MEKVLIDTDVIIDFLRGYNKRVKDLFLKIENNSILPYLTLLNVTELYSGADVDNSSKEKVLQNLLSYFKVSELTYENAQLAGRLRRKYQLGITDSLIASVCLNQNLNLATFNKKHFQKIPGIRFYSL